MPHWLAGSPLRAYHASRARVQSMGHGSTPCPIDMCQWGMGLPPCLIDTCQWGMGQQARARLTRVIWNTSQSGMLHWCEDSRVLCNTQAPCRTLSPMVTNLTGLRLLCQANATPGGLLLFCRGSLMPRESEGSLPVLHSPGKETWASRNQGILHPAHWFCLLDQVCFRRMLTEKESVPDRSEDVVQ